MIPEPGDPGAEPAIKRLIAAAIERGATTWELAFLRARKEAIEQDLADRADYLMRSGRL